MLKRTAPHLLWLLSACAVTVPEARMCFRDGLVIPCEWQDEDLSVKVRVVPPTSSVVPPEDKAAAPSDSTDDAWRRVCDEVQSLRIKNCRALTDARDRAFCNEQEHLKHECCLCEHGGECPKDLTYCREHP